jgi:hypothetical protein
MRSGRKVGRNIFKLLKGSIVISLLFLYFLGSSKIESLHKFFHEDVVLHTAQDESDPCHLTLYHPQRDQGCDHTSHFVQDEKCSLCDIQFHSNPIAVVGAIEQQITFNIVATPLFIKLHIEEVDYQFTGRAPPVS